MRRCPIECLRPNQERGIMRKSRNAWLLVVLVCGLFVMSGCAGDKNTAAIQGVTSKQAAEMNASRADFESSEEPALKAETHFAAGRAQGEAGVAPPAGGAG